MAAASGTPGLLEKGSGGLVLSRVLGCSPETRTPWSIGGGLVVPFPLPPSASRRHYLNQVAGKNEPNLFPQQHQEDERGSLFQQGRETVSRTARTAQEVAPVTGC